MRKISMYESTYDDICRALTNWEENPSRDTEYALYCLLVEIQEMYEESCDEEVL